MTGSLLRVALVTGGNRGIGSCIARRLAERGDTQVVITARTEAAAALAMAELGEHRPAVAWRLLDVTDIDAIPRFVEGLVADFGRLDILVNNAGVALDKFQSAFDVPMATVRATFEANLFGPIALIQAVVPVMRRQGYGRIVNVTSELGSLHDVKFGTTLAYRMSKTALNALTVFAAAELQDDNILVNAGAPGWCATELGGEGASRTADEGADTPVWLATLPDDGPRGGLFRDRAPLPW